MLFQQQQTTQCSHYWFSQVETRKAVDMRYEDHLLLNSLFSWDKAMLLKLSQILWSIKSTVCQHNTIMFWSPVETPKIQKHKVRL